MIKGLIDRIIFTVGVLVFMQAPHFVDQYTQRLGGFYQAQVKYLNQYQNIANDQFNGDLEALIGEFNSSGRESVKQTAGAIQQNRAQVSTLKSDLAILENKPFVLKVAHLATNVRFDLAKETARVFTPGMPFTIEALVCGLLGGIIFSLLVFIVTKFPKLFVRSGTQKTKPVAHRIEPSVTRPQKPVSRLM